MKHILLLLIVIQCIPRVVEAQTPWMFDFDINLTADQAYVTNKLNNLKSGLPGLPPEGIVELVSKQTKLYFYQDAIDWLVQARDSGPQTDPEVTRVPQRCVAHFAFVKPSLLLDSPPLFCDLHQQAAMAAFDPAKLKTCAHVEFPESFVYDQSSPSTIWATDTANLDFLLVLFGDAMTQLIFPTGLVPPNFLPQARKIIAKVRYDKLKADLAARRQEFQGALGQLQANGHCFKAAELADFTARVGELIAELTAVEQDLDGIYNDGLAQAVADRKAVEAQGRMRADLPYPALTDRERELLAFHIGGLSWRVRGGGLINEDKVPLGHSMSFVPAPYQLIADIAGGVEGKDVGLPIYINSKSGYYLWYDMGTDVGSNDKYSDLVELTERGKRATTMTAPVLEGRGFDIRHLVAGGLMMGPCYYYIWEELPDFILGPGCTPTEYYPIPGDLPGCIGGDDYQQFLMWPTATGEYCTGAALALGLVKTLLWGKPGAACTPDCFGKPCGSDNTCGGTCGVCTDAGITTPADGSVAFADGSSPVADGAVQPPRDSGVTPGHDAQNEIAQPPPPADGCSVAAQLDDSFKTPLLALILWVTVFWRRRRQAGIKDRAPNGLTAT